MEKVILKINNKEYSAPKEKKLMDFLREDLHITSLKNGCAEGGCGACSILVDGKAQKTCVLTCEKFVGKNILTLEGFDEYERKVYTYSFAKAGAVQCGFCIPGMVICAKSLIDKNKEPNRIDCVDAIKFNYCRCTGYVKIIDAIMLAAKIFREKIDVDKLIEEEDEKFVTGLKGGDELIRIDAYDKASGKAIYADDIYLDGMLCASAVRSDYAYSIVKKIDISEALKSEGVKAIYKREDVPGENKVGHLKHDWNTFIIEGGRTHFVGDAFCLVVADTWEHVEEAKKKVKIEYEVLKPILCFEEAVKDEVRIHSHDKTNVMFEKHLVRGNADEVIKNSKYKVTSKYSLPMGEHAFLEPECAVAMPLGDGVFIYSSDQSVYDIRRECSLMLGIPQEKIVVENPYVGGGFGGKEDCSIQHLAALAAYKLKVPVKCKLSREESINFHPKRHPMEIFVTTACDKDGYLTAMKATIFSDTGAYASISEPVLERACTHAAGPYNYQVIDIWGKGLYTNNIPSGAFRGFGVTQSCFATEMNINRLAKMCNMDPFEFRYKNAIRPGQVLPNGQIADNSTGLVETLDSVRDEYYKAKNVGIACAMKNAGVGVGLKDVGRCRLKVEDGKVHIFCGASCIGQGSGTVMTQCVCQELKIKPKDTVWHNPNTANCPDSGTTSGSRQSLISGEAVRRACEDLKKQMLKNNSSIGKIEKVFSDNENISKAFDDYKERIEISSSYDNILNELTKLNGCEVYAEYDDETDKITSTKENPISHVAYGYATHLCILNDDGTIKKIIASHEVGKCINRKSTEGQIEGGVVMSMGYALTEKLNINENGRCTNKFATIGILKANQIPEIVPIIIEKKGVPGGHGAIGIGEISAIPTAPAIAGALEKFYNEEIKSLPIGKKNI